MNTMSRSLLVGLMVAASAGTVLSPVALAQESNAAAAPADGKAIFQRALDAINRAHAITADATLTPEGSMLSRAYSASFASIKARRASEASSTWVVRVTGSSGEQRVDVAWTETSLEGVDHAKKTVVERPGQGTPVPGLRLAQVLRLREVLSPQPYKDALAASEYTMEGEKTVNGELCDVVLVGASGTSKKTRWAIARSDSFPRQMQQIFESASMQGTLTIDLKSVRVDNNVTPDLPVEEVRVTVPEGYTEDRQVSTPSVRPVPGKQPVEATPKAEPAATPSPAPEQPAPAPAPTPEPPKGPQAAADFELSTPSGEKVKLADLKGKVVVMQFWGSWCLPCRDWHGMLASSVKAAAGEKASEVSSLALAVRERDSQNAVSELAARNASSEYKLLLNADSVAKQYGVAVFPTTVVVDKDGMIAATVTELGSDGAAKVETAVRSALGLAAPASESASDAAKEVATK